MSNKQRTFSYNLQLKTGQMSDIEFVLWAVCYVVTSESEVDSSKHMRSHQANSRRKSTFPCVHPQLFFINNVKAVNYEAKLHYRRDPHQGMILGKYAKSEKRKKLGTFRQVNTVKSIFTYLPVRTSDKNHVFTVGK